MKILLATDGSANSLRAAEELGRLPGMKEAAEVVILHVYRPPLEYVGMEGLAVPLPAPDPEDPDIQAKVQPLLERTQEALNWPEGRVHLQIAVGDPAQVIADEANRGGYGLVVVGSRGLSLFKEILLGSVSHQVLHLVQCPVLVVR